MKNNHLKFPLLSHSCEFRFFIKRLSNPLKSLMDKSIKQNFREESEKYTPNEKNSGIESLVTMTERAEGTA